MLISKIRKKMSLVVWLFAGMFVVSIFFMFGIDVIGGGGARRQAGNSKIPDTVLTVDGRKIDMLKFQHKYTQLKWRAEQYQGASFSTYPMMMYLESMVVDYFISQEIFLQEAKKRNISADSAEVSKRISQYADSFLGPATKSTNPSIQARAKNYFASQERDKEFREILVRQGSSYEQLKESIRRDVLQEKVMLEVGKEMMAEEKKKAREKADGIAEKLKIGQPFNDLAVSFSEDESTKYNGGDLGWIKHGMLIPEFEKYAFAMQPGQMSQPVETPMGLHIILCIEKKEAAGPDFEAAKQEIIDTLRKAKGDETAQVTDDDIRREYEEVHVKHILIKTKSENELASEWVKREQEKGTHKVEIVNPELKAYRYLNRQYMDATAGEPDFDEALKLYSAAVAVDPKNPYLYYQMGTIYERKNRKSKMDALTTKMNKGAEEDPYAQAIAEAGGESATGSETAVDAASGSAAVKAPAPEPEVDEKAFLGEALESYLQAATIARNEDRYDAMIFLAAGRVAKVLDKEKIAVENFITAVEYAPAEKSYLTQIVDALSEYTENEKAQAALAEAQEILADIESADIENRAEDALRFDISDEESSESIDVDPYADALDEAAGKGEESAGEDEVEIPVGATPVDDGAQDQAVPAETPVP